MSWTGQTGVVLQVGCCFTFTGGWFSGPQQDDQDDPAAEPLIQSSDSPIGPADDAVSNDSDSSGSHSDNASRVNSNAEPGTPAIDIAGSSAGQRRASDRLRESPELTDVPEEEDSDARPGTKFKKPLAASGSGLQPSTHVEGGAGPSGSQALDGTSETALSSRVRAWSQDVKAKARTLIGPALRGNGRRRQTDSGPASNAQPLVEDRAASFPQVSSHQAAREANVDTRPTASATTGQTVDAQTSSSSSNDGSPQQCP